MNTAYPVRQWKPKGCFLLLSLVTSKPSTLPGNACGLWWPTVALRSALNVSVALFFQTREASTQMLVTPWREERFLSGFFAVLYSVMFVSIFGHFAFTLAVSQWGACQLDCFRRESGWRRGGAEGRKEGGRGRRKAGRLQGGGSTLLFPLGAVLLICSGSVWCVLFSWEDKREKKVAAEQEKKQSLPCTRAGGRQVPRTGDRRPQYKEPWALHVWAESPWSGWEEAGWAAGQLCPKPREPRRREVLAWLGSRVQGCISLCFPDRWMAIWCSWSTVC